RFVDRKSRVSRARQPIAVAAYRHSPQFRLQLSCPLANLRPRWPWPTRHLPALRLQQLVPVTPVRIASDAFQRSPNPLAHLDVAGRPESIQVLEHRIPLFARGGVRVNDSVLPRSGNRHRRGLPAVTQPRAHLLHDHAHFHVPADPLPKLSGTKCEPIRFAWTARMEPPPSRGHVPSFGRAVVVEPHPRNYVHAPPGRSFHLRVHARKEQGARFA